MVDFIDEVNEDLRQERFNRFWQKVGGYVVAVSLGIILATVGSVLWQNYRENRQNEAAEAFLAADKLLTAQQYDKAAQAFAAVAERDAQGYTALSRMRQAYALTRSGEEAKAIDLYVQLAEEGGVDKGIRSLARIYAALWMAEQERPSDEIRAMLKPLAKEGKNPFSSFAREQLAYMAIAEKKPQEAHRILSELATDLDVPASLRRRAEAQLAILAKAVDVAAEDDAEAAAQ